MVCVPRLKEKEKTIEVQMAVKMYQNFFSLSFLKSQDKLKGTGERDVK